MRAGKLDKSITIERAAVTIGSGGVPEETWSTLHARRAQVIEQSTDEFIKNYGASTERTVVFRMWFVDGITLADRVIYRGDAYNIVQTKELGRRQGLEIRTIAIGPE